MSYRRRRPNAWLPRLLAALILTVAILALAIALTEAVFL